MRKFLRMFLVMVLATIGFNANAGTIVFGDLGLENGVQYTDPFDGGDFTVTFSGGGNDGKYYNTGSGIRVYGDGKMTLEAKSGSITKIVVTYDGNNKPTTADVVNGGTYDPETGTWTGNAASVLFTRPTGSGHWRVQKLEVTVEGGSTITVSTPTISGTTPFTENTEVTISGTPEGGKTYYTTDGSDPTSSSTEYKGPFTISETTTVKAISYDKDGNASSVATKTFEAITVAANIAAFNALADGTKCQLTLNNAQVLGAGNRNFAIKDATGSTLIFDGNLSYTKGQILNGTIICNRTDYNGMTEIASITENNLTATDGTITPKTATPEEVIAAGYFADTYKMENVECKVDNGRYYITVGENKIQIYDNFKYNYDIPADGKYNLVGVLGAYRDVPYQFWLTEAPEATQEITISEVSDINEFKAQPKGKPYKMTLENAQVVYSWTSTNGNVQSYVRDETGALCFFFAKGYEAVSDKFAVNNILNGSIVMQSNNSQTRADAIEQSNENTLTSTTGTAAEPVKIDATKVSEYLNDLVLLENVTIEEKDGKYYVGDVQLYNGMYVESFDIDKRENFSSFVGEGKNVKGIAVIYQPKTGDPVYEIYPIEITSQGGGETPAGTKAYWDLATWDNVIVTSEVTVDGLTYYGESKSAFSTGNNTFTKGDSSIKCTGRIKMGGGSTFKTDSYSRVFAFNATKGQNVIVFGTHGSSEGDPRTIYLSQKASDTNRDTETAFASQKYEAGEKLWFEGTVPEDGTVYVWADNNMGIYMISVGYTFEELAETSGIETVSINSIKNNIRYNLAGQRVDENYKGVVIMNGKKYVVK